VGSGEAVVITIGTVTVIVRVAVTLRESFTCTVNCDVVAADGTELEVESTPPAESESQDGRLDPDSTLQVNGAVPVPVVVCRVVL
jgi:hypothetical protein